jgi:hypothetical protein
LEFVKRLGFGGNKVFLVKEEGALRILKIALSRSRKRFRELAFERRILTGLAGEPGFPRLTGYFESASLRTRLIHAALGFGPTAYRAILKEYVDGNPLAGFETFDRERVATFTRLLHESGFAGLDYKAENFVRTPDGGLFMVDFVATSGSAEESDGGYFRRRVREDVDRIERVFSALTAQSGSITEGPYPDLSVIVVNWNTKELLRECLLSVRRNSEGLRLETCVVDNGSTDGSPDMIRAEFPNVHLLANESNQGFARAVNRALKQAHGRLYLLLNSDTRVLPETLPRMVTFLDGEERTAVCGAQLIYEDGRLQNSVGNFPTLATECLNKSLLRLLFPRRFPGKESPDLQPREVESVIGASMMVKSEAVREIGFLDEEFFFFLEETDWCRRFRERGWKIYLFPGARVIHLQGKTAEKVYSRARIEYYRSRYTYFRKYYGPFTRASLWVALPLRLLVNVAVNGVISLGGTLPGKPAERFRVYSRILLWHLKGCPANGGLQRRNV